MVIIKISEDPQRKRRETVKANYREKYAKLLEKTML